MSQEKLVSGAELINSVGKKVDKVRTKSLDLSFNELLDMYKNGELIIEPEFQRLFRWSPEKQSRFIESLILEMPIPPIFVIEIEEGKYELIDGLQRISSYISFRGELNYAAVAEEESDDLEDADEEDDEEEEDTNSTPAQNDDSLPVSPGPLVLTGCDIVPELIGHTFESLPQGLQIRLKRNFVRVDVLRKESEPRLRYYMFKRLNTGGEKLSEQEVRNCTIRLLDNTFNQFLIDMSANADFRNCLANISLEARKRKMDQELVLRFFAFKNDRSKYNHDVGPFMTSYMEAVSDPENPKYTFDYATERTIFEKTFAILSETLGANAFSGMNKKNNFVKRFLNYHFESFTLGLQPHLASISLDNKPQLAKLKEVLIAIKKDAKFKQLTTGGGKNYAGPLQERIEFVEKALRKAL